MILRTLQSQVKLTGMYVQRGVTDSTNHVACLFDTSLQRLSAVESVDSAVVKNLPDHWMNCLC